MKSRAIKLLAAQLLKTFVRHARGREGWEERGREGGRRREVAGTGGEVERVRRAR